MNLLIKSDLWVSADLLSFPLYMLKCTEVQRRKQKNQSAIRATVNFVGDFSLQVVERPAKKGRNPRTGETVDIPAKNVVKFKVGSKLKDAVN